MRTAVHMQSRFGIAAAASWGVFGVGAVYLYIVALGPSRYVSNAALVAARCDWPWMWKPGMAWYELFSLCTLALWLGSDRGQRRGVARRVGFWMAMANPFLWVALLWILDAVSPLAHPL